MMWFRATVTSEEYFILIKCYDIIEFYKTQAEIYGYSKNEILEIVIETNLNDFDFNSKIMKLAGSKYFWPGAICFLCQTHYCFYKQHDGEENIICWKCQIK